MNETKYIAIIDQIGRTIIGKQVESNQSDEITIDNPVILHVQPQETGQLEVQSFPLFFFEFLDKDFRDVNSWTYKLSNIVTSNVKLNSAIIEQYNKINTPKPQPTPPVKNPKVISIDDI